jgi:hypothetical protein
MLPDSKRAVLLALTLLPAACATVAPPRPEVAERARLVQSYSARLAVRLNGPSLRARTQLLLAFRRPDSLRIELPGPGGLRLLAVTRDGALAAVFPRERAVFRSTATPADLEALLGVSLSPSEVIDLLVGIPSPRLRRYQAAWGPVVPRKLETELPDGAHLTVTVEQPEVDAAIAEAAFEEPPHAGYRSIDVDEARRLWSSR